VKLYEITEEMRALLHALSELSVNKDEEDEEARAMHAAALAAFEATTDDLRDKLRAYTAFALELRCEREARAAHMDAIIANVLDKMRRQNERDLRKEEWLLATVKTTIEQYQAVPMSLRFEEFTLKLQRLPPHCEITDARAIPADYLRHPPAPLPEPDKKKLLDDLKEGVLIPGAALSRPEFKLVIK
jgi:hypothetical protein